MVNNFIVMCEFLRETMYNHNHNQNISLPLISVSLDQSLSECCSSQWMAPVDCALTALWPSYKRWEDKEEVRGGVCVCGRGVIAVVPPDAHWLFPVIPPPTLPRSSCQLHYRYEMIKTVVEKATTDTLGVDDLRVARLNATGLCGVSTRYLCSWEIK